jgi:hypothetical protein
MWVLSMSLLQYVVDKTFTLERQVVAKCTASLMLNKPLLVRFQVLTADM